MDAAPPTHQVPASTATASGRKPIEIVLGLLLVLPALGVLLTDYLGPTLWTFSSAFQEISVLRSEEPMPVGNANFDAIAQDGVGERFGFALGLGLWPVLTLSIAAPLLAYAAHRAGMLGRWLTRLALAVPMVAFSAVGLAAGVLLNQLGDGVRPSGLAAPETAPGAAALAFALAVFGLVLGWSVTGYLAAFRAGDGKGWPAALAFGGVGVLAVFAYALQAFDFPYVLTAGGPGGSTTTPMIAIYDAAFARFSIGTAAAEASILLGLLMALGVAAAVILLVTRMRVELAPGGARGSEPAAASAEDPVPGRVGRANTNVVALLLTVVGLIAAAVVVFDGLSPWLTRLGGEDVGVPERVVANTWLPPLTSAGIGVLLAALAAYGIGVLRPLGRYSELLLLPFAPWLFVGMGPFLAQAFLAAREADELNTFGALTPPVSLVIPALFVCTLLFRGLRKHGHPRALLWGLPMVGLAGAATWVSQAQDLGWPLVVTTEPELATGPLHAIQALRAAGATPELGLGQVYPLGVLLVMVVLVAIAHVLYLDKLAIRVGRE